MFDIKIFAFLKCIYLFFLFLLHPVLAANSEILLQAGKEEVCLFAGTLKNMKFLILMPCSSCTIPFPTLFSIDAQAVL